MKIKLALLALLLTSTISYGQLMANVTELKMADKLVVAELTLIHRSLENHTDITFIEAKTVVVPTQLNGQVFKMEHYRLRTALGTQYTMDGKVYQSVVLFYDNETIDPRDDIYLANVSIPVTEEFVTDEVVSTFEEAPLGVSATEI